MGLPCPPAPWGSLPKHTLGAPGFCLEALAREQTLLAAVGNQGPSRSGCLPGCASPPRERLDLIRASGHPYLDTWLPAVSLSPPHSKDPPTRFSSAPGTFPLTCGLPSLQSVIDIGARGVPLPPPHYASPRKEPPPEALRVSSKVGGKEIKSPTGKKGTTERETSEQSLFPGP